MNTSKSFAGDFIYFVEVVQICCVVVFTTIAIAIWVNWRELSAVFCILDINAAMRSVESAVTSLAGWGNAVESIAAIHSTDEQIAWFAAQDGENFLRLMA